jgi:flagellar biosynthesis component FlhA
MFLEIIEAVKSANETVALTEPMVQYSIVPLIAILGLAAQLGGSIYSQVKSAQANKEAKAEADRLKSEQDAMYRHQRAEADVLRQTEGNFLDTAMGKGLVTEIENQYKDAIKEGTANGLKREITDESKQSNVQTANKQMTDALSNRERDTDLAY